jgi:hypothetical protein
MASSLGTIKLAFVVVFMCGCRFKGFDSCVVSDKECYTSWSDVSTQLKFEVRGKCSTVLQNKVDRAYTICQKPTCSDRTISLFRLQFLKGWWNPNTKQISKTIGKDFDHPAPQPLVQDLLADFNCSATRSTTKLRIEYYYQTPVCSGP